MHLISGTPKEKAKQSKSDQSQVLKTNDPKTKNAWNNRNMHNKNDQKELLNRKNEHRFAKTQQIASPPPLTVKSNPNHRHGNASVAYLKTGPMSPHAVSTSNEGMPLAVKKNIPEKPKRRTSGFEATEENAEEEHEKCFESAEIIQALTSDVCIKNGKMIYSTEELKNLRRSRRVIIASRARPSDLLPMPITKIPFNPNEKKKTGENSSDKSETPVHSNAVITFPEESSKVYGSGYNKKPEKPEPKDAMFSYGEFDNFCEGPEGDNSLNLKMKQTSTESSFYDPERRNGRPREMWDVSDNMWTQDTTCQSERKRAAFEEEHRQIINQRKEALSSEHLSSQDLQAENRQESSTCKQECSKTLADADDETQDCVTDPIQAITNLSLTEELDDIFKGFNLGGIGDVGLYANAPDTVSLDMASIFSFAPAGSLSTIDKFTEITHGSAFGSWGKDSQFGGERKTCSSGLGRWFSVTEKLEESDSSDSSDESDKKNILSSDVTTCLSKEVSVSSEKDNEQLKHLNEPQHASLILKNMLAVNSDNGGQNLNFPDRQIVQPAGLLESLGFSHKKNEDTSRESTPLSSPKSKTKFTFHEPSSNSHTKKTVKNRQRADSCSGGEGFVTTNRTGGVPGGFVPVSVLKQNASSKGSPVVKAAPNPEVPKSGVDLLARLFQTAGSTVQTAGSTVNKRKPLSRSPSQMTTVNDLESMIM